jgi:hypothetical protein
MDKMFWFGWLFKGRMDVSLLDHVMLICEVLILLALIIFAVWFIDKVKKGLAWVKGFLLLVFVLLVSNVQPAVYEPVKFKPVSTDWACYEDRCKDAFVRVTPKEIYWASWEYTVHEKDDEGILMRRVTELLDGLQPWQSSLAKVTMFVLNEHTAVVVFYPQLKEK